MPSDPPTSSTTTSTAGWVARSRASSYQSSPSSATPRSLLLSRAETATASIGRPTRCSRSTALSRSNASTPQPTVPKPAMPIRKRLRHACGIAFGLMRGEGRRRPADAPPAGKAWERELTTRSGSRRASCAMGSPGTPAAASTPIWRARATPGTIIRRSPIQAPRSRPPAGRPPEPATSALPPSTRARSSSAVCLALLAIRHQARQSAGCALPCSRRWGLRSAPH